MTRAARADTRGYAPPLFGQSARETGIIWRHIAEYTAYVDPAPEALILPLHLGTAREHAASLRLPRRHSTSSSAGSKPP